MIKKKDKIKMPGLFQNDGAGIANSPVLNEVRSDTIILKSQRKFHLLQGLDLLNGFQPSIGNK